MQGTAGYVTRMSGGVGGGGREVFPIQSADPLSAMQQMDLTTTLGRAGWKVRTEVLTRITSTAEAFVLHATLAAFEGETHVFDRAWDLQIPRDNV